MSVLHAMQCSRMQQNSEGTTVCLQQLQVSHPFRYKQPALARAATPACLHQPRYEDNFDAVNNLTIISQPADKGSIDGYGSPEQFLDKVSFLFGKQTFTGASTTWTPVV
jgi:hypothetical protein